MGNKNMRRISILVTAQTVHNLGRLADMDGRRNIGRIVDKLTREKMLSLHVEKRERGNEDKRVPVIRYRPERYEKFEESGLNNNGEPLYVKRVRIDEKKLCDVLPGLWETALFKIHKILPELRSGNEIEKWRRSRRGTGAAMPYEEKPFARRVAGKKKSPEGDLGLVYR